MLLIYLSAAWLAGVFIGSAIALPPWAVLFGLIPLPLVLLFRRSRKPILVICFCLFILLGGAVYYQVRQPFAADTGASIAWIASLRENLAQLLSRILPEPQASLAQGIILGIRDNIPRSVQLDFAHTGTAHILAISGQNLSIFVGILTGFGIWMFGRRHYFYIWLALAALWLYALLTGMQPPVVRGAIMASVFLAADLLGRQRSAFTALAFAAAVMVAFQPAVLWEVSFQLSFLAMVGLIFITPPLQALGRNAVAAKLGETTAASAANFISDSLSVSLGAVLAVWPLIAYYFGIFPWIGPLATFFAVPIMPGIIVFGAVAGFAGLIFMPLASVLGWILWLFLSYMLLVVKIFSLVPFAELRIDATAVLIYYAVLMLILWLTGDNQRMTKMWDWLKAVFRKSVNTPKLPVKLVVPALGTAAVLIWLTVFTLPDDNLHASFLDIGQGDAALFQKGSRQVLIDGGPDGKRLLVALGKEMPFWDRTIELVIITHPDADHYIGLIEVLKRYGVKRVLYSDTPSDSSSYQELLRLIREKGIELADAEAGQRIALDPMVMISVLNPLTPRLSGTDADDNNNGVAAMVEMGSISFLMTADLEWQGEGELVARRTELAATVLKVGHHGSKTSTGELFLNMVNPRLAVISVGKDNTYGHPHKETLDRLNKKIGAENIYRTDERGKIELITDGVKLWVKTER